MKTVVGEISEIISHKGKLHPIFSIPVICKEELSEHGTDVTAACVYLRIITKRSGRKMISPASFCDYKTSSESGVFSLRCKSSNTDLTLFLKSLSFSSTSSIERNNLSSANNSSAIKSSQNICVQRGTQGGGDQMQIY